MSLSQIETARIRSKQALKSCVTLAAQPQGSNSECKQLDRFESIPDVVQQIETVFETIMPMTS